MRTIQVFQEFCGNNTLRTSTAVKLKSLRGSYFLGYVPIFSPVKVDKEREGKRQAERSRQRERERGSDRPCCFSWRLQSTLSWQLLRGGDGGGRRRGGVNPEGVGSRNRIFF